MLLYLYKENAKLSKANFQLQSVHHNFIYLKTIGLLEKKNLLFQVR